MKIIILKALRNGPKSWKFLYPLKIDSKIHYNKYP